MASVTLTTEVGLQEAIESARLANKFVFVKFGASWCGPCNKIAPAFEQIGEKWSDRVRLFTVNADDSMNLMTFYNVKSLPTFLIIFNNEVKLMWKGTKDFEATYQKVLLNWTPTNV